MLLPKEYYSIAELAKHWTKDNDVVENTDIEHCLITGKLKASIKLKPTDLRLHFVDDDGKETCRWVDGKKGFFEIHPYENIEWRDSENFGVCCDFASKKVRLVRDNVMYSFSGWEHEEIGGSRVDRFIRYSDIIIMSEEVKRFELENDMIATPSTEVITQTDSCILPEGQNSDNKLDVYAYLEQYKNAPVAQRAYWLRINTTLNANKIGDLLSVSHDTPGCKSRKVTVGQLIKNEALRLGTWEQIKRKNGE